LNRRIAAEIGSRSCTRIRSPILSPFSFRDQRSTTLVNRWLKNVLGNTARKI
jgi:hypothetical protein